MKNFILFMVIFFGYNLVDEVCFFHWITLYVLEKNQVFLRGLNNVKHSFYCVIITNGLRRGIINYYFLFIIFQ